MFLEQAMMMTRSEDNVFGLRKSIKAVGDLLEDGYHTCKCFNLIVLSFSDGHFEL